MTGTRIIGIDLGTTNSCVAILDGTEPIVLPNSEGSRTTPSVVAFTESGERLVGQVAKRQALMNPENTIYAVKRLIGRRFSTSEVRNLTGNCPFKIVEAGNGDAWVQIRGKDYSPAEVSAMILQKMKSTAEDYLGHEVAKAVITCPAYFNDSQRQATKDAGQISGLDVLRIINEPTAAALAYGMDHQTAGTKVAVFDLGGGTFDISILELSEGIYQVRATNGDTFLGGEDFDLRLLKFLADAFQEQAGIDLRKDRMALQRLKEAAEKAKHELSSVLETEISLPFITADASGPKHLNLTVTRAQLEELVKDLIERTLRPCELALTDANLGPQDLDVVLLVGGMTRMPKVQERVQAFFGKPPLTELNPDEVVAVGAAIQAGVLGGDIKETLLLDVTPLSLGVETAGSVFTRVIPRNTTIPTRKAQVFSTSIDNQNIVSIHVLQGEREMAADNMSLARFDLINIPPAPRGVPEIEVAFDIDSNGIVSVSAKDLGTGKAQSIRIRAQSGLSQDDIQRMVTNADQYKQEDQMKRQAADVRNTAESLIYSVEMSLKEFADKISDDAKLDLGKLVEQTRQILDDGRDYEQLAQLLVQLEQAAHRMTETIYGLSAK